MSNSFFGAKYSPKGKRKKRFKRGADKASQLKREQTADESEKAVRTNVSGQPNNRGLDSRERADCTKALRSAEAKGASKEKRSTEKISGSSACRPRAGLPQLIAGQFSLIYFFDHEKYSEPWEELWHFICAMENTYSVPLASDNPTVVYRNRHTGVEASFRGYCANSATLEVGIEFLMDVPRPKFCAYEALPLVVRLTRKFRVNVKMRYPDGTMVEVPATAEGLLQSWSECCELERIRLREQGVDLYKMRADSLDSVWEHQYLLDELKNASRHHDYLMLDVEYVRRNRNGETLRMCRWPELAPAVFPPVDLVMLVSPPNPLKNGRIYKAADLFSQCKEWIKTEHVPIAHKVYARSKTAGLIEAITKLEANTKTRSVTMRSFETVAWEAIDDT